LWSYERVRDQGNPAKGDWQEVCDLLVVFENHVIVFSALPFPIAALTRGDRWFRRAVVEVGEPGEGRTVDQVPPTA